MNSNQLITNEEALRLFFNDDVYLVGDISVVENNGSLVKENNDNQPTQPYDTEGQPPQQLHEASIPKLELDAQLPTQSFDFKYLGKNEKGILILVHDDQNPVSTKEGTELLRKLVLSINLKNADFALLNYAGYTDAKFEHLSAFFSCKMVFAFGVPPTALGLSEVQLHQLHEINKIKFIFTHNLHDLDRDMPSKKMLWATLKTLTL
jgi:hypothetical protein